jgi:D-3-phosphoglycerate dehydrogenase
MLYITNSDKPGVIGDIGSTTAERGINIANMHLGRDTRAGNAMVLIEVDEKLGNDDLDHLRSLPNITNVQYLHFPAMQ